MLPRDPCHLEIKGFHSVISKDMLPSDWESQLSSIFMSSRMAKKCTKLLIEEANVPLSTSTVSATLPRYHLAWEDCLMKLRIRVDIL